MSTSTRELIESYWRYANARDWPAFGTLLAESIIYEVPQTRERVRGKEAYVEFNATYPGEWHAEVVRIIAEHSRAVSNVAFGIGAEIATGISFFELEDGRITRITDYWPEPYEPPVRNTSRIERYDA